MLSKRISSSLLRAPKNHIYGRSRFGRALALSLLSVLFLMPLITLIVLIFFEDGVLGALPRYAINSLILVLSVGVLAGGIGITAAVMMVRYEFRGRSALETLFILPLALPGFLTAYALVEFFDYAGPLQTHLRELGYASRLPKFRSLGGAIWVLSVALYPYVYIYARQALLRQSQHVIEAARVMGLSPRQVFWRVELPSIRPALAVGLSLVALEVLADFGTVDHFGIETLSTGIFTAWLQAHQLGTAIRIALVLATASLGLLALEYHFRRHASYASVDGRPSEPKRQQLRGARFAFLWLFAGLIVGSGFFLPLGVFFSLLNLGDISPHEWQALWQTVLLGVIAASLVVLVSLLVNTNRPEKKLQIISMTGYTLPGAVLGLGVLLPLGLLDQNIANWREAMGAERAGLLLTGTAFALILAYFIRFFALGNGAILDGRARLSPNLMNAAKVLGQSPWQRFWRISRPALSRSIWAAFMMVFVDVIKELPATLILRPFGLETLATRLYEAAALEDLNQAALSALFIALTGTLSVFILNRVAKS